MSFEILVSKRTITNQKVAVKQFEAGSTMLTYRLDSYKVDQIDLRKYRAFAVTSINGFVDQTELTMESDTSGITLHWLLSEQTLRYAGTISYQIVFKDSEGTSVFNTYEAIIQCSESIDCDRPISACYPTILTQHFNLIQSLSGMFGSEIVYIPKGESIPIEERLDGRLYYQWLDIPTTRAKCATGTVNLGERPYADAGLYINGVHVYIDDTSDTAYAIEPDLWVEAINTANCGVTATNISTGEKIILQIIATEAGAAGNNISLKLDLALYGAGKGVSNPCGGHVSGATLRDGTNTQTGVNHPTGQFEDAHGNILGRSRAKYLTNPDLNTVLEDGEYICAGTMTNSPILDNTYCVLRVTDSASSSRVVQECYCVSLGDNSVRTFVRALTSSSDAGEWRELVTNKALDETVDTIEQQLDTKKGYVDYSTPTFLVGDNSYAPVGEQTVTAPYDCMVGIRISYLKPSSGDAESFACGYMYIDGFYVGNIITLPVGQYNTGATAYAGNMVFLPVKSGQTIRVQVSDNVGVNIIAFKWN